MKKPTRRSIRSGLVALLLLGAMCGALNSSGTFTKQAFAQNYGGSGDYNCPRPSWCSDGGCHKNLSTNSMECTLYGASGTGCSGTRTCTAVH
jgi:hypothetical protein